MTAPVRIPADVDLHDRVLGRLTARQLVILAVTGLVLYAGWAATRALLPAPVFCALAVPVGAAATFLALGQRDGISMDRMVLAAIRQWTAPRHRVAAPDGVRPVPDWLTARAATGPAGADTIRDGTPWPGRDVAPAVLRLPAQAITDTTGDVGVVDLGGDGLAVVAVASTVNFALRTPAEQESLVASFGRYLHSLTAPVQILVRTHRLDLSGQIAELRDRAGGLPHPALETAALEHADYLAQLSGDTDLLRRQVLLILREGLQPAGPVDGLGGAGPRAILTSLAHGRRWRGDGGAGSAGARRAAESRLVRRLLEAVDLLAPAGIVLTGLDAGQATSVLASACNPDTMLITAAGLAGAEEIITSPAGHYSDPNADPGSGGDADTPGSRDGGHGYDQDGDDGDYRHDDGEAWDDGERDDGEWDGDDTAAERRRS